MKVFCKFAMFGLQKIKILCNFAVRNLFVDNKATMEAFYKTHEYLLAHTEAPIRRALMDEIDWNDRLIGIKGTRGVGKTPFLIQYAQERLRNPTHRHW